MKIIVIGSTGGTGRELVKQGLDKGHLITAFAREPRKISLQHNSLRTAGGDVANYPSLVEAIEGHDVVITAIGVDLLKKNTILSSGTKNIIHAMNETGVKRLICESSLGVGDSKGQLGARYNLFLIPLFLKNIFREKEKQEQYIKDSLLDWTIVRPARLTNGLRTGDYYTWTGSPERPITHTISRADVAGFILNQLESERWLRETPALSYIKPEKAITQKPDKTDDAD